MIRSTEVGEKNDFKRKSPTFRVAQQNSSFVGDYREDKHMHLIFNRISELTDFKGCSSLLLTMHVATLEGDASTRH